MPKPQIILGGAEGLHNLQQEQTQERLKKAKAYKDLSTVIVIPTRGSIPARVVENWMGLMMPMNQKVVRMFVSGLEVGEAYSLAIETILEHPELKKWKYVLTLEEDNMPPPDGLLKLYESIGDYAAVGGLYWTKGDQGQPMIYGDPKVEPLNFAPQMPEPDELVPCNGLGMGFTLFNLSLFRDEKIPKPWFQTKQEWSMLSGIQGYTQDLFFFENIRKLGYEIACDTRVRVGHFDSENEIVW